MIEAFFRFTLFFRYLRIARGDIEIVIRCRDRALVRAVAIALDREAEMGGTTLSFAERARDGLRKSGEIHGIPFRIEAMR